MKKYKKLVKRASELEIGDRFKVAGLLCNVDKVDDIFHYVPASQKRISMTIVGSTPSKNKIVVFLPQGTPVTTLH